jgi:hypothetical protein
MLQVRDKTAEVSEEYIVSIFTVKSKTRKKQAIISLQTGLSITDFLLRLLFYSDNGDDIYLRMVGGILPDCTSSYPRISYS